MGTKKLCIIGNNLPDPFFDNYEEEANTARDIINMIEDVKESYATITIDKGFLRKLVHSHIVFIREIDKDLNGRHFAH